MWDQFGYKIAYILIQMQQAIKPYFFLYTDHDFYFKTAGPLFPKKQCLRINRLTSKCDSLSEQKFQQQTSQISAKYCQQAYLIIGIITVLQQPYLCLVNSCVPVGTFMNDRVYQIKNVKFVPFKYRFLYASIDQSDCQKILQGIRNNIICDNFYFCYKEDITLTYDKKMMNPKLATERKYFWNEQLLKIFARHKLPLCWRIPIIQGFISEIHCQNDNFSFYYLNISRRSKYMSGTRFNSRGIDHNFNTANFVETQEIFMCHNLLFSHVSLRGSVPIFWEQLGFGADIRFSKQKQQQNEIIIKKHYEFLCHQYNADIVTVNLLSKIKSPQKQLKSRFQFYHRKAVKGVYEEFDLNEEVKGDDGHRRIDKFIVDKFEVLVGKNNFFCLDRNSNKIVCRQKSIPRINCLDCIDRTNVIMARISQLYLQQISNFISNKPNSSDSHTKSADKKLKLPKQFTASLISTWQQLGNQISLIYCGTESVASHLTKKQNNTFFSYLSSGIKSINRYYNANMNDSVKQECIDYMLGKQDQKSNSMQYFEDNITGEILNEKQYCTYNQLGAYIVTWNCNTVDPQSFTHKDAERLFNFSRDDVDIVVICLQEMVQLNSYNVIMGNNESLVQIWKKVLWGHINSHDNKIAEGKAHQSKRFDYLTGHDLVGISAFVFVNAKLTDRITQLQWFEIKTGFKGSLGNKGVIMLFMTIDSTPITIMNCHLAAGQSKSNERIQDIQYIHQQAIKQRKLRRYFDRSQFKFFIGDFNFRLEAKNESVRQLLYSIEKQDQQSKMSKAEISTMLQALLAKDQFNLNRQTGSLSSYNQAQIYFLPSYKYVKKEKRYDTKRTPSWCDRVLFYRKDKLKLVVLKYTDVDVYLSDHKPVCALFRFLCKLQDEDKKKSKIDMYYKQ